MLFLGRFAFSESADFQKIAEQSKGLDAKSKKNGYKKIPTIYDEKADMVYSYEVRMRSYEDIVTGRPLDNGIEDGSLEHIAILIETKDYQEFIRVLSQHPEINDLTENQQTALHHAIRLNSRIAAEILISRGFDINKKNEQGETVAMNIIKGRGGTPEILNFFISKGANISATDNQGESFTTNAIGSNNLPLLKILLDKGANPNYIHPRKGSLLQIAIKEYSYESVRMLLEKGANPNIEMQFVNSYDSNTNSIGIMDETMNPLMLTIHNKARNLFKLILTYVVKTSNEEEKNKSLDNAIRYAIKVADEDSLEDLKKVRVVR